MSLPFSLTSYPPLPEIIIGFPHLREAVACVKPKNLLMKKVEELRGDPASYVSRLPKDLTEYYLKPYVRGEYDFVSVDSQEIFKLRTEVTRLGDQLELIEKSKTAEVRKTHVVAILSLLGTVIVVGIIPFLAIPLAIKIISAVAGAFLVGKLSSHIYNTDLKSRNIIKNFENDKLLKINSLQLEIETLTKKIKKLEVESSRNDIDNLVIVLEVFKTRFENHKIKLSNNCSKLDFTAETEFNIDIMRSNSDILIELIKDWDEMNAFIRIEDHRLLQTHVNDVRFDVIKAVFERKLVLDFDSVYKRKMRLIFTIIAHRIKDCETIKDRP